MNTADRSLATRLRVGSPSFQHNLPFSTIGLASKKRGRSRNAGRFGTPWQLTMAANFASGLGACVGTVEYLLCVTDSKITLYADDIALYKIIRNPRDYTLLQGDITSVCSWIADNHLVLNILKCCYVVFSRKHHPTLPNAPLHVEDSQVLNKRDHYLGVNFSTDLTWSYHINTKLES